MLLRKLKQELEELLKDIAFTKENLLSYKYNQNDLLDIIYNENDMVQLRRKLNQIFKLNMKNLQPNFTAALASETFQKDNSEVFPNYDNLPKELAEKLKECKLTYKDIIKYQNELKGIYVSYFADTGDYRLRQYQEALGDHMLEIVTTFPKIFENYEILLDNLVIFL